ncbi:hypothetical protein Poly51_59000 [Rubripirellula tenax]|uniref:Uncharacterized protein n=1 Tax=Rubripirellula tenax TaxID=2528015 RepID=A0A5C6EA47_9BACT|nr:hypothetical protein [Rubripirellula tenax]TWU44631.1 hypothetical protein Poly51_59000 [Rubripirellula tenax]
MTYVAVFLYVVSVIITAGGLAIAIDGDIPSHGFIAATCSLIMVPELIWMIPHYADSVDRTDLRTPWIFRLGPSPDNSLFVLALILGFIHSSTTFFLFRGFTTEFAWKLPNILCGGFVFLMIAVLGAILGSAAATANMLSVAKAESPARPTRKG